MGTRTIQLDDDAEATLSVLCNQTGPFHLRGAQARSPSVCGIGTQGANHRNAIRGL